MQEGDPPQSMSPAEVSALRGRLSVLTINDRENLLSAVLCAIAATALTANCFLSSPPRFADQAWPAGSLLKPIVETLGLHPRSPTPRGVEIRNLVFYIGSAALALAAGVSLLLQRRPTRSLLPEEYDLYDLTKSPVVWWIVWLAAILSSSAFAHDTNIAGGGVVVRFLWFAWWFPLAVMLTPRHSIRLSVIVTICLALVAGLGLWYHQVRALQPEDRLFYPIGNAGWMAACLLPGLAMAVVWSLLGPPTDADSSRVARRMVWRFAAALGACVIGWAIHLTGARSVIPGLAAAGFVVFYLLSGRRVRNVLLLLLVASIAAGGWWLRGVRDSADSALRAESIRSRIEYVWPYALRMCQQKPLLGFGEGGYSLLAGQMARNDQFAEPAITAFRHTHWPAHAHNEYLEQAADVGLIGVLAFIAALLATLVRTASFVAATASAADRHRERITAVALAAGLTAMAVESAFGVALRNPGLPPIFLTVWAALWAVVRSREPQLDALLAAETTKSAGAADAGPRGPEGGTSPPLRARRWAPNFAGLFVIAGALALCWWGTRDWHAARALHEAEKAWTEGRHEDAIEHANFAATFRLEPFHRVGALLAAGRIRAGAFLWWLEHHPGPPDESRLLVGHEALRVLDQVKRAAPRFIMVARTEAEAARGLMIAYERRRQPREVRAFRERMRAALEQQVRDEPFDVDSVSALWQIAGDAPAGDRLRWLRGLMRDGMVGTTWDALFATLRVRPDFQPAIEDLLKIAEQDRERPYRQWRDALSPETYRVAARAYYADRQPDLAYESVTTALTMYQAAGARLRAATGAAVFEMTAYRFDSDPGATAEMLELLEQAAQRLGQPISALPPDDPSALVGRLRLAVLLASGQEGAAKEFLTRWTGLPPASTEFDSLLAERYTALVRQFMGRPSSELASHVRDWARRAVELSPEDPAALLAAAEVALLAHEEAAMPLLERFARSCPRETLAREIARLCAIYPWAAEEIRAIETTEPVEEATRGE
jgi:O-antigen ligase